MRKLSVTLGLVLASYIGFAQTDEINLQKYWKLRGDLRENFLKIGSAPGNSIVARAQIPQDCFDNIPQNPLTGHAYGSVHWGDGMIRHGYYLGLLATEYRLLKDAGEDVSGVLNELYYALKTLNRLDEKAESELDELYGYTLNDNLNGFYLREDIPEDYANNWADAKIEARCENSPHYSTNNADNLNGTYTGTNWDGSTYTYDCTVSPNSYQNTPSTDQISALMLGFALINKLVDNDFVQPTATDAGFFVKTEMKAIASRMVAYLRDHNWFYIDVNGWPVNNGGDDFIYASYAMEKFVADLNGTAINHSPIYRNKTMYTNYKRVKRDQYCITGKEVAGIAPDSDTPPYTQSESCDDILNWVIFQPSYLPIHDALNANSVFGFTTNNESYSAFQNLQLNGGPLSPLYYSSLEFAPLWQSSQLFIQDLGDDGYFSTFPLLNTSENIYEDPNSLLLFMNVGVSSKLFGASDANYFANLSGNHQLELIAAVLKDQNPIQSQSFFRGILDGMNSTGPFNLTFNNGYTESGTTVNYSVFSGQSNGWASYDRWTNLGEINGGGDGHNGIFNGLDYLLFHNLYRIKYKNSLGNVSINETCFCETLPANPTLPPFIPTDNANWTIYNISSKIAKLPNCTKDYFGGSFSIANTRDVTPFFSNYSDINVFTPQYLISDLNIASTGILNIKTRYILCGNSILVTNVGGVMNIKKAGVFARSNSKIYSSGDIIVESGTTLKFTDNSSFRLWGKLIIKDGGTVDFGGAEFLHYPGAKIYMEGPNSKLILHKDIKLMGTQDFEIVQLGTEHGQIIIDGPDVKLLFTSATSTFKLIGKNKTQPLLILTNNSKLTQDNAQGKSLKIAFGAVVFGENSKIDAKQIFYADNIHALSTVPNLGLFTQESTNLNRSDFTNVQITANLNIENNGFLSADGCNFIQPNSVNPFSSVLIQITGRGFSLGSCTLSSKRNFGIVSNSLTIASKLYLTNISTPFTGLAINNFIGIQDVSNVEILLQNCLISQSNIGVRKGNGKLSLRCSEFKNNKECNLSLYSNCLLNMSSYTSAGYSKLLKSYFNYNIKLRDVPAPNILAGFNFIESCTPSTNTITGILNTTCTTCPTLLFPQNQWNSSLTTPGIIIDLVNSNGAMYNASLFPMTLKPKDCPPYTVVPTDPNGGGTAGRMGNTLDTITPVIFSEYFQDSILINELIYQAASKISLISENSSDNLIAVNLLDELFNSNLSKTDSLNNFYLNYGLDLMKMAVEESFRKDELSQSNNITSFDPYVAKYVDAMMYLTDSIIDSSNYEMQYVLEIDKAHLMRLTGHPEIGLNILTELENCGLDSIAQANLNFWKQEYETDIIIKQIGQQYLDTTISIDTSGYLSPILAINNYSFGSIINDVNDIQYTNCNFFNTKEMQTGKLSNQIAVYPNPATTLFDIAIKSPVEGLGSFKIVQMDGKTICERQFEMSFNHNEKVESVNWPSGVYTLIVTLPSKEQKRIKVLVQ